MVTIRRNTGWMGSLSRIPIKLNGKRVTKIANHQQIKVEFPGDKASLKAAQFGGKSNIIEVRYGDTVEITSTKWNYVLLGIMIVYSFLMTFVETPMNQTIIHIAFLATALVILFFMDSYRIEVLES